MKNEDYIKKWLNGTLKEEERQIFEASEEYRSLDRLSKATEAFRAPEFDVDKALERLQEAKPQGKTGRVVAMNWLKPLLRVAAVFILLSIGYIYLTRDAITEVQTMAAEKVEIFLPDSSFVVLNASSHLTYPEKKWENERKVVLDGEAFFKVARGSRFDVETGLGMVTVLGTEFNVKNRDDYFEVICYEGLVQVKSLQKVAELQPGHVFRVVDGSIITEKISSDVSPSWLQGESFFESVPYMQVIKEFERQYDKTVVSRNVDVNQFFTGGFVHDDITLALRSITLPLNISYQIGENKQVIISGDKQVE